MIEIDRRIMILSNVFIPTIVKGEVYVVDHDHGIKFLDTSPLIYVDFDGRNLKHPLVHVLGIFISKHVWESDCYF